jgi:hypothetical protein
MSLQVFPTEIIHQVLSLLYREDICECICVCKTLCHTAVPPYYESIKLSKREMMILSDQSTLEKNNQKIEFEYGYYTKSLDICGDHGPNKEPYSNMSYYFNHSYILVNKSTKYL